MRLILDDCMVAAAPVSDLVGTRNFGDVLLRQTRLAELQRRTALELGFTHVECVRTQRMLSAAIEAGSSCGEPIMLLPCSVLLHHNDEARQLIRRLQLGGIDVLVEAGGQVGFFSADGRSIAALRSGTSDQVVQIAARGAISSLSDYRGALNLLSNAFDARHFNSLEVDSMEVVKRSRDVRKMRAEHDMWALLPDEMRRWFVRPYGFFEHEGIAGYRMERLQVADLGLQWVHGALSASEMDEVLTLLGRFLRGRPIRPAAGRQPGHPGAGLYIDKVANRVAALAPGVAQRLDRWLAAGTRYACLGEVLEHYLDLRKRVEHAYPQQPEEAVSHGDLCFSNILYERHARLLRLIDPRGASLEEELWTDASYDWAKLSHSVLGDYDFINHGQFRLHVDTDDRLTLTILAQDAALRERKERFTEWLRDQGQVLARVRIDEASLFISMLPLHVENPHKVLAFLVNAANILHEVEANIGHPVDNHH
jgi:aminoglycoside phosphotransferase